MAQCNLCNLRCSRGLLAASGLDTNPVEKHADGGRGQQCGTPATLSQAFQNMVYARLACLYRINHRILFNGDEASMSEPIFKSIFGKSWDALPTVMQKHYANRPYTDDVTIVEGTLDVMCKRPLLWMAPLMKLMGQIPAHNEKNVPVTVCFQSDKASQAFHFNRTFNFKDAKPYSFRSRMLQIRDNEVIEIMRFGLGWKMLYLWDAEKVILKHRGYALHLFGFFIPVPLTLLMGKGYAEETPVDDETFDMITHITHPWWGRVYEYKGRFKVGSYA